MLSLICARHSQLLQYLCRPELDFRSTDLDRDRRDDFFAPPPSRRRSDRTGESRFEREPDDLCDDRLDDRERERDRDRERRARLLLEPPLPPPLRLSLPRDELLVALLIELSTASGWPLESLDLTEATTGPVESVPDDAAAAAALVAGCAAAAVSGRAGATLAFGNP